MISDAIFRPRKMAVMPRVFCAMRFMDAVRYC